jgi:phosphotransferase system enzyme I (PtsI)
MRRTRPAAARPGAAAPGEERVLEGLGVAPGIAIGPAYLRESGQLTVAEYAVPKARVEEEQGRFTAALAKAARQIEKLAAKAQALHGAAAEELGFLMEAHQQMLRSRRLIDGVLARIAEGRNAESAVAAEIAAIEQGFQQIADPYLRSRASEVREVGRRILRNLSDQPFGGFGQLAPGTVVLAEEVTPADTALMDPALVAGFASVLGGAEGHTAIMARSLGLPAVLGVAGLLAGLKPGATVILDGDAGRVVVNPSAATLARYRKARAAQVRARRDLTRLAQVAATTQDGQRVQLLANIELPRDVAPALAAGAEGVGLLRTEFLFMNRADLPGEDEQAAMLCEVVNAMQGRPVTVRTLDVGGEKLASALGHLHPAGANPALGLRAIRLSLRETQLLETQLAAILRAAALGPVRILLPMISAPQEVAAVRVALQRVYRRLKRRKVAMPEELPALGCMIEVPGAALAADALSQVAEFFAIGTNDLTMYTLAIDRGEEQVAHLYNPLHPAVLRLIQFSTEAALRARIPISVCGEMAGEPRFTPLFLGLGIRELSMGAQALPLVKRRVLGLKSSQARALAEQVMRETDGTKIAGMLAEG